MVKRKGQAALEYMIILMIGLVLITPIIIEGNKKISDLRSTTAALKITETLNAISDTSRLVYSQGVPARIIIDVELPEYINSINITNKHIIITHETERGISDFVETFDFNVTGDISILSGLKKVKVEAIYDISDKVWVNISEIKRIY
ncbi:MAG: hypothetical protein K0B02_05165 [DPANN group archaeon]|nr:hypothetical protein [DPANN group archaeon]